MDSVLDNAETEADMQASQTNVQIAQDALCRYGYECHAARARCHVLVDYLLALSAPHGFPSSLT